MKFTCSRHRDFVLTLRMRLLSEPRVCVCSCIVRCAQQRDGKMHRGTKRYRFFCPCTCICINVLADERALCRAPSSFWSATSPPSGVCRALIFDGMAAVNTFVFLRWPEGTSSEHAPALVRQVLALPRTQMHTVYAILPNGMLEQTGHATKRSCSMALGLAVVPDVEPVVEKALAEAFAHGALPCRYNNETPRRAFSSVAWILADEIPFPQRLRVLCISILTRPTDYF